jgi:ankyrin repeat protein
MHNNGKMSYCSTFACILLLLPGVSNSNPAPILDAASIGQPSQGIERTNQEQHAGHGTFRDALVDADRASVTRYLRAGESPNQIMNRGWSALATAIFYADLHSDDSLAVVRLLLRAGANPNRLEELPQGTEHKLSLLYLVPQSIEDRKLQVEIIDALISSGANPTLSNENADKYSLVTWAAMKDREDILKAILQKGQFANMADGKARFPLLVTYQPATLGLLLQFGANPNAAYSTGSVREPALVRSARTGRLNEVNLLLDAGAKINSADEDGQTALHWAAALGHLDIAELLLQRHAALELKAKDGLTALAIAIVEHHADVAQALRTHGAKEPSFVTRSPQDDALRVEVEMGNANGVHAALAKGGHADVLNDNGEPILMVAARNHFAPVVTELLRARANPNAKSLANGTTALHTAAELGDAAIVTQLLVANANVNARSNNGSTALAKALLANTTESRRIVPMLIKGGAELAAQDPVWLMHLAVSTLDVNMIQTIIDLGWKPELDAGNASLDVLTAARGNCSKCIAALKAAGAGGVRDDNYGLNLAVGLNNLQLVRVLLDLGCDPNQPDHVSNDLWRSYDQTGEFALDTAVYFEHAEMARLLIAYGAKLHRRTPQELYDVERKNAPEKSEATPGSLNCNIPSDTPAALTTRLVLSRGASESNKVTAIAANSDGQLVATASGYAGLELWNVEKHAVVASVRNLPEVTQLIFQADDLLIAATSEAVYIFDPTHEMRLRARWTTQPGEWSDTKIAARPSESGEFYIFGRKDPYPHQKALLLKASVNSCSITRIQEFAGYALALSVADTADRIAVAGFQVATGVGNTKGQVTVIDERGHTHAAFPFNVGNRTPLALSANGRDVAFANNDNATVWDTTTSKKVSQFDGVADFLDLRFVDNGLKLLVQKWSDVILEDLGTSKSIWSSDATYYLSDDNQKKGASLTKYIPGHRPVEIYSAAPADSCLGQVDSAATFSVNSNTAFSAGSCIASLSVANPTGHRAAFNGMEFDIPYKIASEGEGLLAITASAKAIVWDLKSGSPRFLANDINGGDICIACGRFVTYGRKTSLWTATLWDLASLSPIRVIDLAPCLKGEPSVRFTANGELAVRCGDAPIETVSDSLTGELLQARVVPSLRYASPGQLDKSSIFAAADGRYRNEVRRGEAPLMMDAASGQSMNFFQDGNNDVSALEAVDLNRARAFGVGPLGAYYLDLDHSRADGPYVIAVPDAASAFAVSSDQKAVFVGTKDGRITAFDRETHAEIASLFTRPDGTWLVTTPDGRYDSNSPGDLPGVSWVLPSDPLTPLPVESFIKEFYEPGLLGKVLRGDKLTPKSIQQLDRVQPTVRIVGVTPQGDGSRVKLTVEIRQGRRRVGIGKNAVEVSTKKVQDLRVFRDRQLVAYYPQLTGAIKLEADGSKLIELPQKIKIPTDDVGKKIEFSAYAFNEDWVKSLTTKFEYEVNGHFHERLPRAYVISIGMNQYENADWNLRYAASDACETQRVVGDALQASKRYEAVVRVKLVSGSCGSGQPTEGPRVNKELIKAVFDLLAGRQVSDHLRAQIEHADELNTVNPEDLVLITYSGHGTADDQGNFYLFPYDVGDQVRSSTINLQPLISSDDLSKWLRDVDARDMTMIIDACQSAASVESKDFRPGPMGSRGLGQLAYDKGMRILAASQSESVAFENNQLQHGVLTYALLNEGLEAQEADRGPKDGKITEGKWLKYGEQRVPLLYEALASNTFQAPKGITFTHSRPPGSKPSPQQPRLFDFRPVARPEPLLGPIIGGN